MKQTSDWISDWFNLDLTVCHLEGLMLPLTFVSLFVILLLRFMYSENVAYVVKWTALQFILRFACSSRFVLKVV